MHEKNDAFGDTPTADDLPTHSDDGVDLTLIRWMLSLTPEERLEYLEDHAQAMWELRHAFQSSKNLQHT